MSRQINLYSAGFRAPAKTFSAAWTVAVVVAIGVAMAADYAWEARQLKDMRARRSEAGAQVKQLREQLVALAQAGQKGKSKALEGQVEQAESLVKGRQDLVDRLRTGEIGNREGYTNFLAAFARQRVEGLWLTGIDIFGPRSDFVIEGRTVRAELLSRFITMLRDEEALRGKPIGTLALHEREIDPAGAAKGQPGPAGAAAQIAPGQGAAIGRGAARVVEFKIGSGVSTGAKGAAR